jgi:hypothetical protein
MASLDFTGKVAVVTGRGRAPLTPEQVSEHFDAAFGLAGYQIPANANDQMEIVERAVLG